MERLLTDKQKSAIFQVSQLLNGSEHVADLQPLIEIIPTDKTDYAKSFNEFQSL